VSHAPTSTETAGHYIWGSACDGWHLVQAPDLSVIEERMPPGAAERSHHHQRARQFFYVLAGELTLLLDQRIFSLGPGQGLEVAPGLPHHVRNVTNADVRFLVISQPPSHGDRVETVD
jgi:mannose-6-phosphate isomerase-like protein (cupin superfamily)